MLLLFKFEVFDANTKELFSRSSIAQLDSILDDWCEENYIIYTPINIFKGLKYLLLIGMIQGLF